MIKTMKKKIVRIILWVLSVVCIVSGVGLCIYNSSPVQNQIISHNQKQVTKHISASKIRNNVSKKGNFNASNTKEANGQTVLKNQISSKNIPIIGLMSIPAQNIYNPILNGYGDSSGSYLALGACTMFPNEQMGKGNYALAGHHMKSNTIFHSLGKVQDGDIVYLTDLHTIYAYKVISNRIVDRTEMQVFNPSSDGKPLVTMITCTSLAETPNRICVQGTLINSFPATQNNLKKYFKY